MDGNSAELTRISEGGDAPINERCSSPLSEDSKCEMPATLANSVSPSEKQVILDSAQSSKCCSSEETNKDIEDDEVSNISQSTTKGHEVEDSINEDKSTVSTALEVKNQVGSSCSSDSEGKEKKQKPADDNDSFELPSEELEEKIAKQVESYFTDFNIMKDSFLLKHIRRNKEGYISLKLISSFRKVKTLTKDWRIVRYSLRNSTKLQINKEGTKIRRVDPVPRYEETSCAKTVIVFNLPSELPTIESVTQLMSKYGEVVKVTLVPPDSETPEVCTKRCLSFYSDFTHKTFSLVEFRNYENALLALRDHENRSVENGLKVVPLLSDAYKSKPKSTSPKKSSKSPKFDSRSSEKGSQRQRSKRRSTPRKSQSRLEQVKEAELGQFMDDRSSPVSLKSQSSSEKCIAGKSSSSSSPMRRTHRSKSQTASPVYKMDEYQRQECCCQKIIGFTDDFVAANQWMNKRQHSSKNTINYSTNPRLPENVSRWPRGPDGSGGFHAVRESVQVPKTGTTTTDITDLIKNYIAMH